MCAFVASFLDSFKIEDNFIFRSFYDLNLEIYWFYLDFFNKESLYFELFKTKQYTD